MGIINRPRHIYTDWHPKRPMGRYKAPDSLMRFLQPL